MSSRLHVRDEDDRNVAVESDNFLLLPDINPLIPGHSLLITKSHLLSFAQLPDCRVLEFREIRGRAVSLVTREFAAPFLFEHGSTTPQSRSGVCVQHAHIHLLPTVAPVLNWLTGLGEITRCGDVFAYAQAVSDRLRDYLAYEDQQGFGYLVGDLAHAIPCQFIRRMLAVHLNLQNWDWMSVFWNPTNPRRSRNETDDARLP